MRNWPIGSKLLAVMLLLSALAVAVSAMLGYRSGRASLKDAVTRQLAGIRRARAQEIERYFQTVRRHVITLSDDRMFIDGARAFGAAFRKLEVSEPSPELRSVVEEYFRLNFVPALARLIPPQPLREYLPNGGAAYFLQNEYIVRNPNPAGEKKRLDTDGGKSDYAKVHATFHPGFRQIVDEFGYYDLLLVDRKEMRVVYSVEKETDFATSLAIGPYRNSTLARIAAEAANTKKEDEVFVSDFAPYEASLGAPAAFVASPIFDRGQPIGVFVLQLSIDEIDRVVSGDRGWEQDGLGRTGDVEIVGDDRLMRSTARSFQANPQAALAAMRAQGVPEDAIRRMEVYETTILQRPIQRLSVDMGLAGEEGTMIEQGSSGKDSLVSFMPLRILGLHWMMDARISLDEALAPVESYQRNARLWGLVALLLAAGASVLVTRQLVKPVNALAGAVRKLEQGDLTARVPVYSTDELGKLSSTFNQMASTIQEQVHIIDEKNRENEALLINILPEPIAERLKRGETTIADSFAEVSVLFADIVGFTNLASTHSAAEIVTILNGMFTAFDGAVREHGVEKIKTIGDCYMAVAGLPEPCTDPTRTIAETALDFLDLVKAYGERLGIPFSVRIGINSGPVVAGVIGTMKFIYDLWGDTVNVASRMESTGVPGAIQVTRAVYERLGGEYEFENRGPIAVKGKGEMNVWLLRGRIAKTTPEPVSASTRQ